MKTKIGVKSLKVVVHRDDEDQNRGEISESCRSSRWWRPKSGWNLWKLSFIEVMKTKIGVKSLKVVVHRGDEDQFRRESLKVVVHSVHIYGGGVYFYF